MFKKIALLSGVLVLSGFTVYNVFSKVKPVNAAAPCIITISGIQYDVAPLQTTHTGGNVFVCGTDMTALFMSMPTHAADIARMTPYIYIAPTATPTTVPTIVPTVTPVPSVVPTVTPVPSIVPTVTPSPSVSPAPHHDDENENEAHETEHKNENHETKTRGKSQEHASEQGLASRNQNSQHKDN